MDGKMSNLERLKSKNLNKKIKQQKKQAKQKKRKSLFLHRDMTTPEKIVGTILFILLIGTFYFVSPFSRVSSITIEGTEEVSIDDINKVTNLVENQTILSVELLKNDIIQNLKTTYPRIKNVSINIDDARHVIVKVEENQTIAYVQLGEQYYAVLEQGVILMSDSKKMFSTIPLIKWSEDITSLEIMAKELANVDESIRQNISEIVYNSNNKFVIDLYMNDGNVVKVNYTQFANKLNYYNSMKATIEDKKGIIDLTVGAYFTPFK